MAALAVEQAHLAVEQAHLTVQQAVVTQPPVTMAAHANETQVPRNNIYIYTKLCSIVVYTSVCVYTQC